MSSLRNLFLTGLNITRALYTHTKSLFAWFLLCHRPAAPLYLSGRWTTAVALISKIQFNIHHREYNSRTFSSYMTPHNFNKFSLSCVCVFVYLQVKMHESNFMWITITYSNGNIQYALLLAMLIFVKAHVFVPHIWDEHGHEHRDGERLQMECGDVQQRVCIFNASFCLGKLQLEKSGNSA